VPTADVGRFGWGYRLIRNRASPGVPSRKHDTLPFYIRNELIREICDETFASEPAIGLPLLVGVVDEMLRALANEIRKMLLAPLPGDALRSWRMAGSPAK
jgi:hypothetical protein